MTQPYRRKLKTLVGAASVIAASNDSAPDTGIRRAISLAKIAEREKITGLFTADLLQADPAGLAGTTGSQDPLIALAALSQATSHIGLIATVSCILITWRVRSARSTTSAADAQAGTR